MDIHHKSKLIAMAFITKADFNQEVHTDILNALTKNDDTKITANINSAIDEMKAYLNGKYDTDIIFGKVDDFRNKYLLKIGLDIATYYIYKIHNPRKMGSQVVYDYEKALEKLTDIRKGIINPLGLEVPVVDTSTTGGNGQPIQWGSQPQLESDY